MQLYEQGKLDIDDKLGKYFPDYKYGDIISLRQLLSQRSGIPDYSVDSFDGAVWATCDNSDKKLRIDPDGSAREHIEAIRELYLSCDLLFEPGEMFYYSDSNFSLLAAIVERVSGKSYHEYVRDNIFEPLGLKTAAFIDDHSYPEGVTVAATDRQEFDYDYFDYKGVEFGCGDIMLSPADLYRWYRSFSGGKAVRESSYKLMTTNCSDEGEPGYGFGLMIADGDSKALYHYGWIPA